MTNAVLYQMYLFTILLKDRTQGKTQPTEFQLDPEIKMTKISLVVEDALYLAIKKSQGVGLRRVGVYKINRKTPGLIMRVKSKLVKKVSFISA